MTISATGRDGVEVIGQVQRELSRTVFLGHRVIVVIGEKYARSGIDRVLDSFLRMPGSRYNSYIVTSYGATAKEILNAPYSLEHIPAFGMSKILLSQASYDVKIGEFLDAFSATDKTPVTAAVRLIDNGSNGVNFIMDRLAVYRGNKLTGYLTRQQLQLFLLTRGKYRQSTYTTRLVAPTASTKGTVSLDISRSQLKIRTRVDNGIPSASLMMKLSARIWENDTELDLSKDNNLALAERHFAEDLKETLLDTVAYSQRTLNADILDIGRRLHTQHPQYWKTVKTKWPVLYRDMAVDATVELTIERTGRTQAAAHLNKRFIRP